MAADYKVIMRLFETFISVHLMVGIGR